MLNFEDLDPSFTVRAQAADRSALPTVMLNLFRVDPRDSEAFKAAWAADAKFFKTQPGWISAQLHRGIGDSHMWFNYALFESTEAFAAMNDNPEFQRYRAAYPQGAVAYPHLFRRIGVPGICLGEE